MEEPLQALLDEGVLTPEYAGGQAVAHTSVLSQALLSNADGGGRHAGAAAGVAGWEGSDGGVCWGAGGGGRAAPPPRVPARLLQPAARRPQVPAFLHDSNPTGGGAASGACLFPSHTGSRMHTGLRTRRVMSSSCWQPREAVSLRSSFCFALPLILGRNVQAAAGGGVQGGAGRRGLLRDDGGPPRQGPAAAGGGAAPLEALHRRRHPHRPYPGGPSHSKNTRKSAPLEKHSTLTRGSCCWRRCSAA